jgi:hypothetical protein
MRAEFERELGDAHRQMLEREDRIKGLEHTVRELERELAESQAALQGVLSTRAWRTAERLRTLRHGLLPWRH